jgi:glycosyltransferase involved in cell wall biosynthesis
MKGKIFFFAQFPPPVHGASSVNQYLYDELVSRGCFEVIRFSFVKQSKNTLMLFFNRILKSISAVFVILKNLRSRRNTVFYMPVSGGLGMVFEIVPWLLAGLLFNKRVMHHHSLKYCYKWSVWMYFIQTFRKKNIHNIFLCECHRTAFSKQYPILAGNSSVISNEMVIGNNCQDGLGRPQRGTNAGIVVGHLSNLSVEKGCITFFDLAERLAGTPNIKFELAGPARSPEIEKRIEELLLKFPGSFNYRGPLYGSDKLSWYRQLDFFIFPSTYLDETYPLVISEAISAEVIPLTTPVGCLPEINHSAFILPTGSFNEQAEAIILRALADEAYFNQIKKDLQRTRQTAMMKRGADLDTIIGLFARFLKAARPQ